MFQKKVHYVSQLGSMDCGIACLTMILNYYGCKSDIVDIGAEIQIGRDGMTLAQMKELAEKYGFKFAAYQYNHEEKSCRFFRIKKRIQGYSCIRYSK